MAQISTNLRHLRNERKLSQQELADMMGIGRTTIANIESNLANPGHKTLLEIVKIFDVTIDDLLNKDLSTLISPIAESSEKTKIIVSYRPVIVTVDSIGDENIVLVDTKAAAGYPTRYLEPEFYKELPAFKLPGTDYRNGTFRCFQVDGDSMQDTIQHGDYVIGRFCDNHFKDVKDGHVHVVVTNDNVLVKRLVNKAETEHKMHLISDNETYPEVMVDIDEIKEIWFVKSKLSSYMPVKKNDIDKLIGDLTMQVHLLKSRLDNIEKN